MFGEHTVDSLPQYMRVATVVSCVGEVSGCQARVSSSTHGPGTFASHLALGTLIPVSSLYGGRGLTIPSRTGGGFINPRKTVCAPEERYLMSLRHSGSHSESTEGIGQNSGAPRCELFLCC